MMKKSKILIVSIPLMLVLFGFLMYQYVYIRIQTEVGSIKESQSMKTKTLEKCVTLIAEKPQIERDLRLLKKRGRLMIQSW